MKKLILLPALLLLLASCSQYEYHVQYEKCNGQTGSISYIAESQFLYGQSFKIPSLYDDGLQYPNGRISNICDFSYTRNEIK